MDLITLPAFSNERWRGRGGKDSPLRMTNKRRISSSFTVFEDCRSEGFDSSNSRLIVHALME